MIAEFAGLLWAGGWCHPGCRWWGLIAEWLGGVAGTGKKAQNPFYAIWGLCWLSYTGREFLLSVEFCATRNRENILFKLTLYIET